MPSPTVQRVNESTRKLDEMLNRIAARDLERLEREEAEQHRADAAQSRANSENCRQIADRYDPSFAAFGVQTPQRIDGERPGQFRKRLYESLRKRLPSNHNLFDVYADDIPGSAARVFEQQLLEAARAEAARPSVENLPPSGELIKRVVTDPMSGSREIHFFGTESFIKSMGRPGSHVARIMNPKTGEVWFGSAMPRIR